RRAVAVRPRSPRGPPRRGTRRWPRRPRRRRERALSLDYHSAMPLFAIGEAPPPPRGAAPLIPPSATLSGSIVVEDNANVRFHALIRADNEQVTIGEGCNIQDGSVLHVDPGYPMTLGRRVSIGHKVMLHGCTIGEGSLVGINSVVMNGARI